MESQPYDPRFVAGVHFFNDCEFYEAHEVWEDLWTEYQGPARGFYQGLIQIAVCLHHFGNGNTRGAKKLYFTGRKYLEGYLPKYEGVDLQLLFDQLQQCCAEVIESQDEIPRVEIVPDLIPEIDLDPPPSL